MSTAFMVDNILQDKEEQTDSLASVSSDSEDYEEPDQKDTNSLCDSPKSYHQNNSSLSDDEMNLQIRPFTTMLSDHHTHNLMMDYCCGKCGHYQSVLNNNDNIENKLNSNSNCNGNRDDYEFKCEKCGYNEFLNPKETILKEAAKPVLKFSVSAILGDKKDCVKVRNGKKKIYRR